MKIRLIILFSILTLSFNLLAQKDTAYVKGKFVDISEVMDDAPIFPQNKIFKFRSSIPKSINGKKFTSTLIEYEGVTKAKFNKTGNVFIAYPEEKLADKNWVATGESFAISSARNYYIYKFEYTTPQKWINILTKHKKSKAPTLLFSDEIIWTNSRPIPGTVIAKAEVIKKMSLTNPTIVVLPDGDYLAAISGAFKIKGKEKTSFFLSSDKGKTWKVQSVNSLQVNYGNLFVVEDKLYIMGTSAPRKDVVISTSADKGVTWTKAKNENTGIILKGSYHSAPVPTIVHNGRVWRAMETNIPKGYYKKAFVMSAPLGSDLLKASNWTSSEKIGHESDWISDNGRSFKQWLEGNAVADRDGNVVNILRIDEQKRDGVAAIITLTGTEKASFDPQKDIINFPGGGKKFTIRYDKFSDKYWALSNAVFESDFGKQHSGNYKKGLNCGLIRNNLVLMYSDNLRDWTVKDTLITSSDSFFHGFQYVDWQFDGNDIVAVSRTAFEEERGLPVRQHDANLFLFHRFSNFRTEKIKPIIIPE